MKRFVLTALLILLTCFGSFAQQDELTVMFWNLENFFDWKDGGQNASDSEFSSNGSRRWTSRRFFTKVSAVSKTILWAADRNASLPDVVAFAEVENEYVIKQLVYSDALRKYGYSYIHHDSPDPRGIDVALIYRKDRLTPLSDRVIRIKEFPTRDILEADFLFQEDTVHVIVNHHPSKYGGASTGDRRRVVMGYLADICDSLEANGGKRNIVAVGDFNDTPESEAFGLLDGRLVNLAEPLSEAGEGSIRFDGKWELIDMVLVSEEHAGEHMEILYPPFLLTRDAAHSGFKPLRTYSGPRYLGGVSDHLPVCCRIYIK